jgi:hypothetical protein
MNPLRRNSFACAVPIPDKPTAQAYRDKDPVKDHPHDDGAAPLTADTDAPPMPPADAWDHFADDGHENDPSELYA